MGIKESNYSTPLNEEGFEKNNVDLAEVGNTLFHSFLIRLKRI